ncbi:MAG: macro domain-containing protein [Janthinobacterium lividum]
MKVLLVDLNTRLCEQWQIAFDNVADVHIHNAPFESLMGEFDCFVSPANSFGLTDGGIDESIIQYFGQALQDSVQREIWRCYRGEQPVGTCLMVPTANKQCAWLAHCPTMRIPMDVSQTNHAYAAFITALISAEAAGVKTLACPGLGTLTGRMPPDVAARQMRFAFDRWHAPFTQPNWQTPQDLWRSYGRPEAKS